MARVLIDAGPIIAYFDRSDDWHAVCSKFIDAFVGQFITTTAVITEVMWHTRSDHRVQNEFLRRVYLRVFRDEPLVSEDYARIAELNSQYADLPADFADLSLIVLAERLRLQSIVTIDGEFDLYRKRHGHANVPLRRIVPT